MTTPTRPSGAASLRRGLEAIASGLRPAAGRAGGMLVPGSVRVGAHQLEVDGLVCRTLVVTGYPREVGPGWLSPLLTLDVRCDVALHVHPIPPAVAAERLRRQLARMEASRRLDADRSRLADPSLEVAAEDAADLAGRVARGEGRLFRVAVQVTVWADDEAGLEEAVGRVRGLLASLVVDAQPSTFRALQGWVATRPFGLDPLGLTRTFDTEALAAAFPFASPDLPVPEGGGGVLYGVNAVSGGLVWWDRWAQPNYNAVVLARSGAGKSYLAKLEALRSLYGGVQVLVVDPEDEYVRLADAVGGTVVRLGAKGVRLNPLDLDPDGDGDEALVRRGLFCHTLVPVLVGRRLEPAETAALDRAVLAAYAGAGITADPRTHRRPAPLLGDLASSLGRDEDPAGPALARLLAPYVSGTHAGLFEGPTTTRPDGHLVVLSTRELADPVRPAGTLLALDALWRTITNPRQRRRRLLIVDEAWLLAADPAGSRFLLRLAKSARKHWCGLTTVTQDAADLLGSDLGRAVVANASTQILLGQAAQAIDAVTAEFGLSAGERPHLLAARPGEGLLSAVGNRVTFTAVASDDEHRLVTTDPAELADLEPPARSRKRR